MEALVSHLTTKCRRKDCQAKSAVSARFSRIEQHIFYDDAPAAAICGVKIPIRRSQVVGGRKTEGLGGAVDGGRRAFQFQKYADGSLVEVQMQAVISETGSEFFVLEAGAQAERRKTANKCGWILEDQFAFGTFFVARSFALGRAPLLGWRRLGGKHCFAVTAGLAISRRGSFDADSNQPAVSTKIRIRRIEERVSFEDAAVGIGAEALQPCEDVAQFGNVQLDFDFRGNFSNLAHMEV
jgi:hypothetical protein